MTQHSRETDEVSRKVELSWLMAFYGGMLTEKQHQVLSLHCEEDLSLGEIAQEAGVSRQGVHDMITRAADKLFDMEEKLGLAARLTRLEDGVERCRTALKDQRYDEAAQTLDALMLLDQEENDGL